jgi:hypothetical protein
MRSVSALLVILLFTGSTALADPITTVTYDSRAGWQAAATGIVSTITFEVNNQGIPFDTSGAFGAPGYAHLAACCPSFGQVMFRANAPALNIADTTFLPAYNAWHTGNVLSASGESVSIILQYHTEPVNGLAFEWLQLWGTNPVTVSLSSGESFVFSGVESQPTFFGVRSSVPIIWLEIAHGGSVLSLDNVSTESPFPTPEPASILLFGSGLAGVMARGLRRRTAGVGPRVGCRG